MSSDATTCKVCGGPFGGRRVWIDGEQYHERCSLASYAPHTHEDMARLNDTLQAEIERLRAALWLGRIFLKNQTDENAEQFERVLDDVFSTQSTS